MKTYKELFGQLNGRDVFKYTVENNNGISFSAINFGCVITDFTAYDNSGNAVNLVLGFDNFEDYLTRSPYFGAIVGRVAGRIKNSEFELDGVSYKLPQNEGCNHLHGNSEFSTSLWEAEFIGWGSEAGIRFNYLSPDMSNGYPGNVALCVTYSLNDDNELSILYEAETDRKTVLNLTNHSYFNLSGCKDTVCNHILKADVPFYVELKDDLIPTGRLVPTEGTDFDFSEGHDFSKGMLSNDSQHIIASNGYDHALVFNKCKGMSLATLSNPENGICLEMQTDYPCFVLYTGNQLPKKYMGVCLEAQLLPDAIHNPDFGNVILSPGELYRHNTIYKIK